MRKFSLAVIALIVFAAVLFPFYHSGAAQPVVIRGKVTDTRGKPITMALIDVPLLNASTLTDSGGRYRLVVTSKVRSGQRVVIRASREGFDHTSRSIVLAPGKKFRENFRLAPIR